MEAAAEQDKAWVKRWRAGELVVVCREEKMSRCSAEKVRQGWWKGLKSRWIGESQEKAAWGGGVVVVGVVVGVVVVEGIDVGAVDGDGVAEKVRRQGWKSSRGFEKK